MFHARPVGEAWFDLKRRRIFSSRERGLLHSQIEKVRRLNSPDFRVHCVTARNFTEDLGIKHDFDECAAVFMTCVFQPGGTVGLCCDRRGDAALVLARVQKPRELLRHWGGRRHKRLARAINLARCPRCTFASHNEIFECAVKTDSMCVNFI